MSNAWIFAFGIFTAGLCVAFVVVSARELSRGGRSADATARAMREGARSE